MNVLLLAGGLGTRLRPLTERLPKPMALVANRPWLEHLLIHLKQQGVQSFVIAAKHYPEAIQNYLGNGEKWGVEIRYAIEKTLLGTAGAIKNAEPYLDDRFIVINADIVHDVSIAPLLDFHERHGGGATIALTEVDDPTQYGVVAQDKQGRILRFVEKPRLSDAPSRRVNAGIYVLDKEMLRDIPPDREVSIEKETFPLWIERNRGVFGTVISGYWMDMGTKERYRQIHWDVLNQTFRLPIPLGAADKGVWIGRDCDIHPDAMLVPPVMIGDRVKVGAKSIIGPFSVIGSDSIIGKQVRCSKTIMWDRCLVRNGAVLNSCVFGHDLEIGSEHVLHEALISRSEVAHA